MPSSPGEMRGRFADRLAGRAVLLDGQRTYCWWELLAWVTEASISNVQAATSRSSVQVCIVPGDIEKRVRWWADLLVPESTMPAQTYDDSRRCDGLHKNCLGLGRGWAEGCADLYLADLGFWKP